MVVRSAVLWSDVHRRYMWWITPSLVKNYVQRNAHQVAEAWRWQLCNITTFIKPNDISWSCNIFYIVTLFYISAKYEAYMLRCKVGWLDCHMLVGSQEPAIRRLAEITVLYWWIAVCCWYFGSLSHYYHFPLSCAHVSGHYREVTLYLAEIYSLTV